MQVCESGVERVALGVQACESRGVASGFGLADCVELPPDFVEEVIFFWIWRDGWLGKVAGWLGR